MPLPVTRLSGPFTPEPLPDDTSIWRVMDTAKLSTLISDGGLWFARLDQFGDALEGTAPQGNIGLLAKYPAYERNWTEQQYTYTVRRSFASCWHINKDFPSSNIWTSFGGPDCIAVRTSIGVVRTELQPLAGATTGLPGPLYIGKVRYIDHCIDVVPEGNFIEPAFVVQDGFSPEVEARLLLHTHGTAAYDHLNGMRGPYGELIQPVSPDSSISGMHEFEGGYSSGEAIVATVNPNAMVQQIARGPDTTDATWSAVEHLAQNVGLADRLRSSP